MGLSYDKPDAMGGTNKKLPKLTYKPKTIPSETVQKQVPKPTLQEKKEEPDNLDKLTEMTKRGAFVKFLYDSLK